MKLIGIEVPDDAKAVTVTVLTPDNKKGGLAMITKGIDTVGIEDGAITKFEIVEVD